jgi:uncharacterized protein (TIGR01244 family)
MVNLPAHAEDRLMNIVKLAENLAVSAQITPGDVAGIAAAGYKVIVNNRPDGEESTQPGGQAIADAARAVGLEYHYMPVTAQNFPGPHFDALSDLFDDPARPVLAFCRSGTRCANLWVASRAGAEREQATAAAKRAGFDLAMAATFIAREAMGE